MTDSASDPPASYFFYLRRAYASSIFMFINGNVDESEVVDPTFAAGAFAFGFSSGVVLNLLFGEAITKSD